MHDSRRQRGPRLERLTLIGVLLIGCVPKAPPPSAPVRAPSSPAPLAVEVPEPPPKPATSSSEPSSASGPSDEHHSEQADAPDSTPRADPPRVVAPAAAELPQGTLVLHVGDSFAGALGIPLGKRFRAAGLRSALQFKTASYIPTWAFGRELGKFVASYDPDLILVTLGANELDMPDPNQRIGAIERLVHRLGGRPCVWISPPLWKSDSGLMDVIRAHVAPCRFLDSDALVTDLPRERDRIHPSVQGREIWADAVFAWLAQTRDPSLGKPWSLRADRSAE